MAKMAKITTEISQNPEIHIKIMIIIKHVKCARVNLSLTVKSEHGSEALNI